MKVASVGLWRRLARLVAVRHGNPLHFGIGRRSVHLPSLYEGLSGTVKPIADGRAFTFATDGKGGWHGREAKIATAKTWTAGVRPGELYGGCDIAGDPDATRTIDEARPGCWFE